MDIDPHDQDGPSDPQHGSHPRSADRPPPQEIDLVFQGHDLGAHGHLGQRGVALRSPL
jgi:hypothetical protein